jgi:hypothetical protein
MIDNDRAILAILEKNLQPIKSRLGPQQWAEFSRRVTDLVVRFATIASENNPQAASNLKLAVNDLLEICWDYEDVTTLLYQGQEAFPEPGLGGPGSMRPEPPQTPDIIEVKEIANRYYSLLARLKEMSDQTQEDVDDHRTHT